MSDGQITPFEALTMVSKTDYNLNSQNGNEGVDLQQTGTAASTAPPATV
jgi:hypothetical protein